MHASTLPRFAPQALRAALVTAAFALCGSAQAQAIQKCRVDGRIVFQAAPCPSEPHAPADAPAAAEPQGATGAQQAVQGPPAPAKKRTLAEALRDRDVNAPVPPTPREKQIDGSTILRSRMGAV